jgi:hypothetical protein
VNPSRISESGRTVQERCGGVGLDGRRPDRAALSGDTVGRPSMDPTRTSFVAALCGARTWPVVRMGSDAERGVGISCDSNENRARLRWGASPDEKVAADASDGWADALADQRPG